MWSNATESACEPFVYRESGDAHPEENVREAPRESGPIAAARSEVELRTHERRGYERGVEEGEAVAQKRFAAAIIQSQALAASVAAEFERERAVYFQRVEAQVVRLALAVARKILHRESQLDPLLLAGVARVALEQVASGSVVRLYINPSLRESWREFFSKQSGLNLKLEWIGDASLDASQCRLETTVGTTHINLEDQLNEISQGFFDLLAEK